MCIMYYIIMVKLADFDKRFSMYCLNDVFAVTNSVEYHGTTVRIRSIESRRRVEN